MRPKTPGGSSSGSAAGVAAGFAPVSIGGETDGSVVYPAARAGIYALKISHGALSLSGSMPFHPAFDCHGLFAKTPRDLADLAGILLDGYDSTSTLATSWKSIRLGIVNPDAWRLGDTDVKPNEDFQRQSVRAHSLVEPIPNLIDMFNRKTR